MLAIYNIRNKRKKTTCLQKVSISFHDFDYIFAKNNSSNYRAHLVLDENFYLFLGKQIDGQKTNAMNKYKVIIILDQVQFTGADYLQKCILFKAASGQAAESLFAQNYN